MSSLQSNRRPKGVVAGATAVTVAAVCSVGYTASAFLSSASSLSALRESALQTRHSAATPLKAHRLAGQPSISPNFQAYCGMVALLGASALAAGQRRVTRRAADEPSQPSRDPEIDPRRQDEPSTVPPVRMPMIDTGKGDKIDVMSKLLQDRIIICGGEVKDEMAQVLVAQMLYLANESNEDITMYINSPGGSVSAGMAIYDTMQFIPCEINTVCFGMAASMGSFLLAAGTKGKRKSLPNSRIMIHQPLGGAQGQAIDVRIQAREILHMREILNMHLSDATGKTPEEIQKDCDRDNFMTPEEAKEYGLIDEIIPTSAWPRIQKPPRPGL
eukprot:TRINITY_DN69436_c0_g1_i1.p1 TRINITY_DN69436_c0_g1~~TRINITY_DN69436_c0_g1_i1.p1  ORF type:complete len:329 (+),score=83.57 TRINITY_DN69436_c0_g1_i1:58-1044(+)